MNKETDAMKNALQAVLDKAAKDPLPEEAGRERPPTLSQASKPAPQRGRARANSKEAAPEDDAQSTKFHRPVREGKRFVGAHFHPEVARQLKVLAAEDNTTIQDLLEEAVDLLFVKNGRAKITEIVSKR
jgi:hypothetical protein